MGFDLGELELLVGWVHLLDLFNGRGAEDLDDFNELISCRFAGEEWFA